MTRSVSTDINAVDSVLYTDFETVRSDVNRVIAHVLDSRTSKAADIAGRYGALWQAIAEYVLAGGKRIRPYLTVAAYQLFGGTQYEKIVHVAAAQEFLNQALLMHDDIIDRDYVRYGVPNVAGRLREYYSVQRGYSVEEAQHYADAGALLAGDLCIRETFVQVRNSGFSADEIVALVDLLDEALFMVVGGELLDSETYTADIASTDPLVIVRLKTAVYSVVVPLVCGAQLAGAAKQDIAQLRLFGEKLGMAYQLADDDLGVFGDAAVTGKSNIGDLREGKHTYLMQQTWHRAFNNDLTTLEQLFGKKDLTQKQADKIRKVIVQSGARATNKQKIDALVQEALAYLDSINAPQAGKQVLRDFCVRATKRKM